MPAMAGDSKGVWPLVMVGGFGRLSSSSFVLVPRPRLFLLSAHEASITRTKDEDDRARCGLP
jgi:hypothetical protein